MSDSQSPSPIAFEARAATTPGSSTSPATETFRWGSRWIRQRGADGNVRWREVPLTWEDLLDPQEGDVMVHGTLHGQIICNLAVLLRHWFESRGRGDVLVTDDVKMFWGIPGLANIAPDVAVIENVNDPERARGSFKVAEEGTRPSLAIEVISRSTRDFDYQTKPEIYQRAGIRECLFVDPLSEPWKLFGHRLSESGDSYRPLEPDPSGGIVSQATGLCFRIGEDEASLVVEDAATGERLRTLSEEAEARRQAERQALRATAEKQALEAKLARLEESLRAREG